MSIIDKIISLFKKPEPEWFEFQIKQNYDLIKHPEISPDSPINAFSLVKVYRYAPEFNILERKTIFGGRDGKWLSCTIIGTNDIQKEVDKIQKQYKRSQKLNTILK